VGAMEGQGIRRCFFAEEFKNEEWKACRVMTDLRTANAVAKEAMAMLGGDYDTRAILGVWARFVFKRLGIKLATGNAAQEASKFFCSELVGHLYQRQGIRFTDIEPALLAPSEIYEANLTVELPMSNREG
jgi:hypothetical protein